MKRCPYCAEEIQGKAIVCGYCGNPIPGHDAKQEVGQVIGAAGIFMLLSAFYALFSTGEPYFFLLLLVLGVVMMLIGAVLNITRSR